MPGLHPAAPDGAPPRRLTSFQRLALWTTATTYFLIFVGGLVRASGAGLGCPDWPRCFGSWIPPLAASELPAQFDPSQFNPTLMWTEYLNRLLGVTVGLLIFATLISAIRRHRQTPRILWSTVAAFLLVGFQGWLGGVVVQHELAPWIVTVHLIVALIIVSLLLYATVYSFFAAGAAHRVHGPGRRPLAWSSFVLILVTLVQVGLGAQVRGAIDEAMLNGAGRDIALSTVGSYDIWHREAALIVLAGTLLIVWLVWSRYRDERALIQTTMVVVAFVLIQIALGVTMAYLTLTPPAQIAHLTASSLLLGAQTVLFLLARWLPVGVSNEERRTKNEELRTERPERRNSELNDEPSEGGGIMRLLAGVLVVGACTAACGGTTDSTSPPSPQQSAQPAAHGHAAPGAKRTALLGNLGSYHRTIVTTVADTQSFFNEGLTLLYGFNHEEAFRSFERAAALDAQAPMPHWGMSLALGTNYNDTATPDRLQQAYAHLSHAVERAKNGNDIERALIEALAKRYVATPDDGKQTAREQAYAAAMGEVVKRYPGDLDAVTLHAESMMNLRPWKLYTFHGDPEPGTEQIVTALESVLQRNPDHPGANHYLIHAVEASRVPERGLPAAKRLADLVPGAGHLVHMPAHIWIRTGDYRAAARTNAVAAEIDEKYVKATGATGFYPMMYYGHNVQFESAAAMYAGNLAQARAAGTKIAKLVGPMAGDIPMLQPFALQDVFALVRFEQWDDVLAQPAPPAGRDLQTALYHHARGAAFAGKRQVAEAETELKALEAAAAKVPKDVMYSTINPAPLLLEVARLDLAARIADARPNAAASVQAWTRAVVAGDKVGYGEPPDWLLPAREGLGAALMRAGRAAEAEKVYREDLLHNRANPRSLFGLWKSLERQSKPKEAAEAKAAFESAWLGADVTLTDAHLQPAKATN